MNEDTEAYLDRKAKAFELVRQHADERFRRAGHYVYMGAGLAGLTVVTAVALLFTAPPAVAISATIALFAVAFSVASFGLIRMDTADRDVETALLHQHLERITLALHAQLNEQRATNERLERLLDR